MVDNGLEIVPIKISLVTPNNYNPNVVQTEILAKLKAYTVRSDFEQQRKERTS